MGELMDCPFCAYWAGDARPAGQTMVNQCAMAFEPLNPATPGHTLVIPGRHVKGLGELTGQELTALFVLVATVMSWRSIADPPVANVVIQQGEAAGQSVEHLHVHVVPRREGDGLGYQWGN